MSLYFNSSLEQYLSRFVLFKYRTVFLNTVSLSFKILFDREVKIQFHKVLLKYSLIV
jgi:hypothetical protein